MTALFDTDETVLVKIPGQDFFNDQTKVAISKPVSVMGKITY